MHFKMSSAICFNLNQSKILSSGNEISIISPGWVISRQPMHGMCFLALDPHTSTDQTFFSKPLITLSHALEDIGFQSKIYCIFENNIIVLLKIFGGRGYRGVTVSVGWSVVWSVSL